MPGPQNAAVTVTGSTAVVPSMQVFRMADGTLQIEVWGTASASDGSVRSNSVRYILAGPADTTVRGYMDGQALTKWRTANGLEAP